MRHVAFLRRVISRLSHRSFGLAGASALLAIASTPAFAIPSPELVVGSFVSLSQLLALVSAILGGGAAYAGMRSRDSGAQAYTRNLLAAAVGLFVLAGASIALSVYLYIDHKNQEQARLEATLTRPSRAPAGLPDDPDAKELNFSQQNRHPLRISTAETARLLDAHNRREIGKYVFLDVRERAEQVMGSLQGATFFRFPDLKNASLDLTDKTVILFCHNGNRSFEAAETLRKMGIEARFMAGGLEKWITEGRHVTGLNVRDLAELVPNYLNRNTLIDTVQAQALAGSERAIFVDVRFPTDFAASHIDGAINLNLRRMPTEVMNERIAQLPKRPIILPCYDRSGCFFAKVLGYELARAGHDVRGRYTLPWEYFIARGRPAHVEAWIAEKSKGIWARATDALTALLARLAQWTGVPAAIALLALLSRLLVLPFALKAERDQIRTRAAAAELDEIKNRLADQAVRRGRAIRAFYARLGITPGRNLLALLFLPVMAVALTAVQQLAGEVMIESWLWLPSLGVRDLSLVLPVVFGVLITLYIDLAFATSIIRRIAIWLISLPLMTATGALLSAGADIYLITSAALLLVQRLWVSGLLGAALQAWRRSRWPAGVIPLADVSRLAGLGNKAYRLAQLRAAGLPVPDGVLLMQDGATEPVAANNNVREQTLDWIWRRLGRTPLAVRSCASSEDGAGHSFAGVFESVLNVDRAGMKQAIAKVRASYEAVRVGAYMVSGGTGGVLIQRMVKAEYAGVLFTRDPSAGALSMIEMVQGLAESLVSGVARPQTYRFGRATKKPFGAARPPIDLAPLLALGDEAERLFGGPQDIEWAYSGGHFYLVQSRDITRPVAGSAEAAAAQGDLARVVDLARGAGPDEIVFAKNELSEMLPRPTPLSLSLMESLWTSGGSVDQAARALGLSYRVEEGATYLVTVLGRLYIDKREERRRALAIGKLAGRRLVRDAYRIERQFREAFLPPFLGESRLLGVADLDKLPSEDLVAEIARQHDRFINDTHVEVDIVNIAASFYIERACKALDAWGVDPSGLLGNIPETFESRAIAEAAALPEKGRRWLLLRDFGHRAVMDYELSEQRYAEDLNTLTRMVAGRTEATRPAHRSTPPLWKSVARIVDIARRFQSLKEDAKHHSLREIAGLRRTVLALDKRFGFEGSIFYLTFEELLTVNEQNAAALRERAAARRQHAMHLRQTASLPSTLTVHQLEAVSAGELSEAHTASDVIRGTRVAGSKLVVGRAHVVPEHMAEQGAPLEGFRDGDIVVTALVSPAWLPYFPRAGGFVSEVGGWLSHPAILAREYDVAMIVGTRGISRIVDGSTVRLHLDGRLELVAEDEDADRIAAA